MPSVQVFDRTNKPVGELELDGVVFGAKPKTHIVYEEVKHFLAGRRAGTHSTKSKGMVRGGGKKPWRQKGTGRARAGSIRSPLWRGGGTAHGPHPRSYDSKMNRQARKLAMRVVLTDKLKEEKLLVLDAIEVTEAKTKRVHELLAALGIDGKALIVEKSDNASLRLAARNHPRVSVVSPAGLSVYDILRHDRLVLTRDTVEKVQEMFRP